MKEETGELGKLRIGFVAGTEDWTRKQQLLAKHLKMRLEGLVYPDVFSIPYFLGRSFDFILEGEKIPKKRYDLLLAELQGSESQLRYLESLVCQGNPPVVVIPGPPEIFSRDLTHAKMLMARNILERARYVWAYSDAVCTFWNGLIGRSKAVVIPWPFDTEGTRRVARAGNGGNDSVNKILIQVPIRFSGLTQNHPFILKSILHEVWNDLPDPFRRRFTFHTFAYASEDKEKFISTGFSEGLPVRLEKKMGYVSFLRFLGGCKGVINLTTGNILGRITFLSAALGRPGIFSDNTEINRVLYPNSVVSNFDTKRLRDLVSRMFDAIEKNAPEGQLLPSEKACIEIGDFAANSARTQKMVSEDPVCAES